MSRLSTSGSSATVGVIERVNNGEKDDKSSVVTGLLIERLILDMGGVIKRSGVRVMRGSADALRTLFLVLGKVSTNNKSYQTHTMLQTMISL